MCFTISQSTLLIMAMAQKWFLAFGAYEMLDVPVFAQCGHHTLFDWTTACTTNWYAHFIVTPQTIQFIDIVGSEAGTTFHLTCGRIQFGVARCTVEVIAVIDFIAET